MKPHESGCQMDAKQRGRANQTIVLKRLQEHGRQVAIATAMGVSETTVSRMISERLESMCELLAHAGLRIVPTERVCVDPETYRALTHIATKAMSDPEIAERLVIEGG